MSLVCSKILLCTISQILSQIRNRQNNSNTTSSNNNNNILMQENDMISYWNQVWASARVSQNEQTHALAKRMQWYKNKDRARMSVRERDAREEEIRKNPTENNNKNQKMFGFHCIITNSFISSSQVSGLNDSEQKEWENKHDKTVMSVNIMRAAAPYLFYVCMLHLFSFV